MINFNKPYLTGNESTYIQQAFNSNKLSGDGKFTKLCHSWFESELQANKALLTHSCTAALEMAAILADLAPGDEVIMPSYTFVSTANAFALRGAIPVFVDIRPDTLNLDEELIESAITTKTKAIVPVHYAGVSCEMDKIMAIAKKHNLFVIEDAAQGVMSKYKSQYLGTIGDMGAYSFHETKNINSGEGGALLVNSDKFTLRAEVIREKGTDRSRFYRGEVDKYTWQDIGSSYLPSEMIAAFLYAQLEKAQEITNMRLAIWQRYYEAFAELEKTTLVRRPFIPQYVEHNAHMFYLLLDDEKTRDNLALYLKQNDILAIHHYVPLHNSPAGIRLGRAHATLPHTESISARLIRLPLYNELSLNDQEKIIRAVYAFFAKGR